MVSIRFKETGTSNKFLADLDQGKRLLASVTLDL